MTILHLTRKPEPHVFPFPAGRIVRPHPDAVLLKLVQAIRDGSEPRPKRKPRR